MMVEWGYPNLARGTKNVSVSLDDCFYIDVVLMNERMIPVATIHPPVFNHQNLRDLIISIPYYVRIEDHFWVNVTEEFRDGSYFRCFKKYGKCF